MSTPNEKLADSLSALQALQKEGRRVFSSKELSRIHRERLLRNGFVQEVMKGWLISSSPSAREGDSTRGTHRFGSFAPGTARTALAMSGTSRRNNRS